MQHRENITYNGGIFKNVKYPAKKRGGIQQKYLFRRMNFLPFYKIKDTV